MKINDLEMDLDLGCDHYLKFMCWKPDRELNPEYRDLPDCDKIGAIINHKKLDGTWCSSGIYFDCVQIKRILPNRSVWRVESWEPLTVSPSILCLRCKDHGFIREGKWVKA